MTMIMNDDIAMRNYLAWINAPVTPEEKAELRSIVSKPDEILSRFSGGLNFGTAGLRAVMETGTARINSYTVAEAACAIAESMIEQGDAEKGIAVSYDSRNNSRTFAEIIARVAAESGVRVFLSDEMRPVPVLSFAIRKLGAAFGVMVTASHNPREYNGMKVYGADGGQIKPETAARIIEHMGSGTNAFAMVRICSDVKRLVSEGRIEYFGAEIDDSYNEYLKGYSMTEADDAKEDLRIIYTPLNGCGYKPVRRILSDLGYKSVFVPPEQADPDGDFPSMRVPNPEFADTFDVAVKYAKMSMADVIIATDPDSDRLGVAVPDNDGEYEVLTGNQIGILIMEYLLSRSQAENGFCVTSIVSSKLAEKICKRYGVKLYRTLTGSKYVADLIKRGGQDGGERFLFGFEEGNGYMFGGSFDDAEDDIPVRDKDAIAAAVIIAEMAALSKHHKRRLSDQFKAIYDMYGYGYERNISVTCKGADGKARIESYMAHFRENGPDVGEIPVRKKTDYLPESDVLLYELGMGDDWIAVRPSGTEPKLKIYVGCYGSRTTTKERCDKLAEMLEQQIASLQ